MATCTACATPNPDGNRFCGGCGLPLTAACPSCGATAPAGQRFCGQCGHPLTGSPGSHEEVAAGPGAGSELRWVSVVFVDLVGSTALAESLPPEDVRLVLSGYFDLARDIVDRYGGVVEKFIGDAVVAVWGSRVAHEDDAERAVRAALDVVEAVATYGAQHTGTGLAARAGVVTGEVVTWSRSEEGLVAGDRVNTAARVQAEAGPGAVVVDELTRRASEAAVAYRPLGERVVKGKTEPLRLWQAERVVAGVGGTARVDGLETGFLGRTRELAVVKELFHAALESGRARLVTVSGSAGVGKSRLGWEFEKYVDGLAQTVLWHRGRCLPYGDGVALWPLNELVRQRLDLAEDDDDDIVAARLTERLPVWIDDEAECEFVRPRLETLLGVGTRDLSPEELFAGWRLFLERLAQRAPVVWVVEDAQWADSRFLEFLEQLLDWSAASPLFVMVLARPDLAERNPDWAVGRSNASALALEPLPDAVMARLLDGLVPQMPADVKGRIVARSAGVPLYAVETLRTLVDRDLVVPEGGQYRLVGEVGELDVPATLTSLLTARLDGLPPAERELVKRLAVLGGSFPRAAVDALTDAPSEEVDRLLRSLLRREVLTVQSDPLSPRRGQFAFVQTMLLSVALSLLTRHERKAQHLAVATYLRASFPHDGEEVAEVLAAHYEEAHRAAASDPDAGPLRALAVEALERAGRRAADLGAPAQAGGHFRRAASLSSDEQQRLGLLESAADMALRAGRNQEALETYDEVVAGLRRLDRRAEAAALARRTALALARMGRHADAEARMRQALEVLRAHPDPEAEAWLHSQLIRITAMSGRLEEALDHAEHALSRAAALDHPELLGRALAQKGGALVESGRVVEGVALSKASIELFREHGMDELECFALGDLGSFLGLADLPGALEASLRAADLGRRLGEDAEAFYLANAALSHLDKGTWSEGESCAERAVALARGEDSVAHAHFVLLRFLVCTGRLDRAVEELAALTAATSSADVSSTEFHTVQAAVGHVALVRGDAEAALTATSSAARACHEDIGVGHEVFRYSWPLALDAALRVGRLEDAASLLELVEATPRGHVPPYLRGERARYRGLLDARQGNEATVEERLREAVDTFESLGYPHVLARALADLGEWLIGQGRRDEGEALLARAAKSFADLGARPDLDRLDVRAATEPA